MGDRCTGHCCKAFQLAYGLDDVNAVCVGGWLPREEWETKMMPWLAGEVVPGWDGRIWPTHVIEVMG